MVFLALWVDAQSSMSFHVRMKARTFKKDNLGVYVRPYTTAICDYFLLKDDNVRPYRPRIMGDDIQQKTIQHMMSRGRSSDLNPIEHVWDALGKCIDALSPKPEAFATLATALQKKCLFLST